MQLLLCWDVLKWKWSFILLHLPARLLFTYLCKLMLCLLKWIVQLYPNGWYLLFLQFGYLRITKRSIYLHCLRDRSFCSIGGQLLLPLRHRLLCWCGRKFMHNMCCRNHQRSFYGGRGVLKLFGRNIREQHRPVHVYCLCAVSVVAFQCQHVQFVQYRLLQKH